MTVLSAAELARLEPATLERVYGNAGRAVYDYVTRSENTLPAAVASLPNVQPIYAATMQRMREWYRRARATWDAGDHAAATEDMLRLVMPSPLREAALALGDALVIVAREGGAALERAADAAADAGMGLGLAVVAGLVLFGMSKRRR
jgi:hypothetical protein